MRRPSAGAVTGLDLVADLFYWGLLLSGVAVLLITGYYIFGVFAAHQQLFEGLAGPGQQMSSAEFQRHIANMELLTRGLLLASLVLVVSALGRFYAYPETGVLLAIAGAALFFGMPFLIDHFGGSGTLPAALRRIGDPRSYLKARFGLAGLMILSAGAAQLLAHGIAFVLGAAARRPRANAEAQRIAQQVRKPNDRFLGPCWTLPFCRDTEKKLCPIRHSKKPCWRGGRGCYCDQNIVLQLSGAGTYSASRGGLGYMARSAAMVARPKSWREKREQCLSCPIYLHHQNQKHRVLAPGALVGAIAAFAYFWGDIQKTYPVAVQTLGRALSGFSFGTRAGEVPQWAVDLATNTAIMWLLVVVAAMLIIAYLLHGVEWVLYRLGI